MKQEYGPDFMKKTFPNRDELREVHTELEGLDKLNKQMSDILNRTAIALHGGPLEMGMWSWHDLPELAEELYKKANKKGFHKTSDFKSDAPDGNIPC